MESYIDDEFSIKIEDGIVYIEFFFEHGTWEIVDRGIKKRNEMTKGKAYPMLSDVRSMKTSTREGRQRMSDPDSGEGVIAGAVIINSKVQQVIYNLFQAIYKAPTQVRLFTNKDEAVEWIKQFKQ
jgi:hypothetical protein